MLAVGSDKVDRYLLGIGTICVKSGHGFEIIANPGNSKFGQHFIGVKVQVTEYVMVLKGTIVGIRI